MERLIYKLNLNLIRALNSIKRRESFNRDHIFYDIISLIKNKVTSQEKLRIIYVFSEIEKVLSVLKIDAEVDEKQINKIDEIYSNLDEKLKYFLSLSYYPMKALYYFQKKEFNYSIDAINIFFDNSKSILGTNTNLLNLACGEQYLNLFRIYLKSQKKEKIITCSSNLMLLCHYKLLMPDIDETIDTSIKFDNSFTNFDKNEYLFWKVYHTDNIFKKFIIDTNNDLLYKMVSRILSNINYIKDDFFYNSLRCLDCNFNSDYEGAIIQFINSLEHLSERSDVLLYLNMLNINKIFLKLKIDNEEFKNLCNKFINSNINKNLKIEMLE
ncbi:hypothetical protein OKE68_01345 [Riemerella anatipestifer]|uniref:Uncharacterized protein n=3 Tax=Riemerella anatipestifer TaxID=34085 RepID=A0AAP3AJL6_RIEAN|nr:hypothetical protein [Riemerella anatipestifer]AZZ58460.1 hypothetical protein AWB57_05070 [Riemerella anatipestifer]MBT0573099.1 hypothetical protein [Riemerella anatipestifer]MCW0489486.1 hypothetical protein [Riemerella anatipestifer]MCW0511272.1 hypothetical protein [Riemerella anatipestifer]MCW0518617.1 hypothetical protein [Riemerella anatipestifer]